MRESTRPAAPAAIAAALLWGLSLSTGAVLAEVAIAPASRDNTLIETLDGSRSNGAGPHLFAGRTGQAAGSIRRGVIAFDVASAIPPGATVTSAVLTLHMSRTSAGPVRVDLRRLLAEWGEGSSSAGGGLGAPSTRGDATWIHTFYDDRFWTFPGGDFGTAVRASVVVDQPGSYSWGPTPEMAADVQSWLDDPGGNHGWILTGGERLPSTAKRFDSRENPVAENRPSLRVEFVPPCDPRPAAGTGYWHRQCLGLPEEDGGLRPSPRGRGPADAIEPGFAQRVLPCARATLADLGLDDTAACAAVAIEIGAPADCPRQALRDLTTLVFNLCSGRIQSSCPAERKVAGCASTTVGGLLREIASLILAGECRLARRCAGR
ncbi:MAG: DNRLRE domain-containing protein [Acidobacteriota bacterium]